MDFGNKDSVPHNFALNANSSTPPPAIFQGTANTASTTTYKFAMIGIFIVAAVSSGDGVRVTK
jgi:hypothetical protein